MRPLAQTFLLSEPSTGAEAVFLTAVDVYFASKPSTSAFGIELQIRETLNGIPIAKQLPYASKTMMSSSILTSSDGSAATRFTFDTPVMVRTNEVFAIAVIPLGGDPNFRIWSARRDAIDVGTGNRVVLPNNVGNLYLPSNDLSYTHVQNSCLKFKLVTANFTSATGTAVFKPSFSECFTTRIPVGNFQEGERVVISDNQLNLASLTVALGASLFTNNEIVVQPNTATNTSTATAFGTVYSTNSTVTLLRDTNGKFQTTGGGLRGLTSGRTTASANMTFAFTDTVTISACNIITVPTTITPNNDFVTNNFIYVGAPNLSGIQVARITSVNPSTRQLTLDKVINFANSDAAYGRVKSDGELFGIVSFSVNEGNYNIIALTQSSANASQNFTNSNNAIMIGTSSGSAAVINSLINARYDSITPQITAIDSKDTNINFRFRGTGNTGAADVTPTDVISDIPHEFFDRQRVLYSRSNEITALSHSNNLVIEASLQRSNAKFSPYIDTIRNNIILTTNQIKPDIQLSGFYMNITNANGVFVNDTVISQANATSNTSGKVLFSNSTVIGVYDITTSNTSQSATFIANGTSIITGAGGVTANVTAVSRFNEALGNGLAAGSRYISKTVVLTDGQDSEDLVVFLSAYRPQGTNVQVYTKLLNATDSDPFDDKSWTPMLETTTNLVSSLVNRDDYVELQYVMPQSVSVHTSNISVNTTSSNVVFTSGRTTGDFTPDMFIYVTDPITQTFAVRRVLQVINSTALAVASNLTFTSTNAAIGYIEGSLAQCNAFRYNLNNGIVRYVCNSTDSAFDGYKTFAIKIVLTSNATQIVPRIADMRALALQI
jgi:hypothetical protein